MKFNLFTTTVVLLLTSVSSLDTTVGAETPTSRQLGRKKGTRSVSFKAMAAPKIDVEFDIIEAEIETGLLEVEIIKDEEEASLDETEIEEVEKEAKELKETAVVTCGSK